jgi:decaprenylphospho-beta-D-ribofuranose 2-oxidase
MLRPIDEPSGEEPRGLDEPSGEEPRGLDEPSGEEPTGLDEHRELLKSYGRVHEAWSDVWEPEDLPALIAALKRARAEGHRVTFRAGGHSFHDQALNQDVVLSIAKLNRILDVDEAERTITVEPAARWGEIVAAALAHDLYPYVVVSTSEATAGGTLSSDGISRHSPSYGSESAHILSFDLLLVGADAPRTIVRPDPDDDDENAHIFRAVIGGFGYLGCVTRITYRLLSVKELEPRGAPLQVATELVAVRSFVDLIEEQMRPRCDEAGALGCPLERRPFPPNASEEASMFYSIAFLRGGNGRGAIYRSWYTRGRRLRPYLVFRPQHWLRILLGVLATFDWVRRIGNLVTWWLILRDSSQKIVFVNEVLDFTFFMDANAEEKRLVEQAGLGLPIIQQTFVVPVAAAAAFLDEVPELLAEHTVEPTLFDILHMPADLTLMSASHDSEGFACTLSFEDVRDEKKRDRVVAALYRLSERCHAHGGRVHLTKNVYALPETMAKMYGPQLERFLALKAELDPDGILRNAFFERVFAEPAALLAKEADEQPVPALPAPALRAAGT